MSNCLKIAHGLVQHWKLYKRDFPWRHEPSPYKIMVVEFMLQRTRAEQVKPVYEKFLAKYPTVFRLANAREKSVCGFTGKLGLHKRGPNFIRAAKYVVDNYNGDFPADREELLSIPGVGDYVAGAILTVCFKKSEYVIDANIARFINRYFGLHLRGEIRRKKEIIDKAKDLFNYPDTRSLLFALLDFTALICKPLKPDHDNCFLKKTCRHNIELLKE